MKNFSVWWPDSGQEIEDAKVFCAYSAEYAAEDWANWYEGRQAEYPIVEGEVAVVHVLEEGKETPVICKVRGWIERVYEATEIESSL